VRYLSSAERSSDWAFIDMMLDTCREQLQSMEVLLNAPQLKDKVSRAFIHSPDIQRVGIKPVCAKALHILLTHGQLHRGEFKVFTGLGDRLASEQLAKLIALELVEAQSPKSRQLCTGLPLWFAEMVFPELHPQFKQA